LRFDLPIHDLSEVFQGSGFRVFDSVLENKGRIVALVVPGMGDQGRGYMDRIDKDVVRKQIGAGGLIYFKLASDGSEIVSSVKEHVLPRSFVDAAIAKAGAKAGDLVLVLAGTAPKV